MALFATSAHPADAAFVNVIAEATAKAGHADALRAALTELVARSRTDDGCTGYHLLESKNEPGVFRTFEEWTNEAALQAHLAGASDAIAALAAHLDGTPTITVYTHVA